ncbi:MAG: tetratricopeptide repeat protein [Tolypothrix brevis GSE-NOS-MK-07-07A]|jgi:tetratricopeptide (TPR) repeat protein|nr:tetratricopeptide repeat protein [Tolypothrix brevis GSE-NOS-MK-07-07A]
MALELTKLDEDLPSQPDEEYQALVRTLNFTEGFGLLFVRCSPAGGEQLITKIKEDINNKNIEVIRLKQAVNNLYERIDKLDNKKEINILFITGLEHSFYEYEECKRLTGWDSIDRYLYSWKGVPPVLINLNQQRERFKDNFNAEDHQTPDIQYDLLFNLGNLQYAGRNEDAIASYDEALSIKPDYHQAWYNRGYALRNLGRYEDAIASYDEALSIKPDYHQAWYNRGIALQNLGRNEDAIASNDQALSIKPDYQSAWYNKACYYALQGNIEQTLENLQQAINLSPDENREMAKTDSDFDSIRDDERFQGLIQG